MEISLIRHGKSKMKDKQRITCTAFQKWIETYDRTGVCEEIQVPNETLKKITTANILLTSHLERSMESAALLTKRTGIIADELFRETELPIIPETLGLKLRPNTWAVLSRWMWLCGYSRYCESLANAKQRAKSATSRLIQYAERHQTVVLIGHGFFNHLITLELQKMGWKGKRRVSFKHWSCTTYSLFNGINQS